MAGRLPSAARAASAAEALGQPPLVTPETPVSLLPLLHDLQLVQVDALPPLLVNPVALLPKAMQFDRT